MSKDLISVPVKRRTILKAGLALGAMQVASPFVVKSLADEPVKIGLDNPLTGTFAALGKNELIGAQLALDQINANNGILGRKVELLVEDSTSGDTATAVQKADKLIDRDKVNFLIGNINSALAQAMANESNQKGVFHIVPGGHTDSVTGTQCHWNVFRVCNTTRMETNSVSKRAAQRIRQEVVLHHHRLRLRPLAAAGLRSQPERGQRHRARRRLYAARHHRLLGQPDQGAVDQPGRHHPAAGRRRHDQLPQAGGAVRPQ